MLRWTTKAAIFDRREHETQAQVFGEQRHRLVHHIRRMILRRCGRDDPAIVDHWKEHTEFDHLPLLSPKATSWSVPQSIRGAVSAAGVRCPPKLPSHRCQDDGLDPI